MSRIRPFIKVLSLVLTLACSFAANAIQSNDHVIEKCAQDIVQLAASGKIPTESAAKLHMVQIRESSAGFELIAILDHNGDHSQMPGHLNFKYDVDGKLLAYEYIAGYVTANETPFVQVSSAKFYALAIDFLQNSKNPELKKFAQTIQLMELEFDQDSKLAVFVMVDANNSELHLFFDLEGRFSGYQLTP